MAKFRGSKGTVSIGGTVMAQTTKWEFTPSRPYLETTCQGDGARTGTLDQPQGEGTVTVRFDKGLAQQASLLDMLLSNADPTPLAAVFLVDTGKTFSMNILPTSAPITSERGSIVEATFSYVADGAMSSAWA